MQFVLLISESPEAFAARNDAEADPLEGAVTAPRAGRLQC